MNEIEIINNLRKIVKNTSSLDLQDDVFFDKKNSLIVSIDTYNENIHYINFNFPNLIVKKVIISTESNSVLSPLRDTFSENFNFIFGFIDLNSL